LDDDCNKNGNNNIINNNTTNSNNNNNDNNNNNTGKNNNNRNNNNNNFNYHINNNNNNNNKSIHNNNESYGKKFTCKIANLLTNTKDIDQKVFFTSTNSQQLKDEINLNLKKKIEKNGGQKSRKLNSNLNSLFVLSSAAETLFSSHDPI
jgi:hypothetical protein